MEEVWKDIKGYEGVYQISNTGFVKSSWSGRYFAGYYNFRKRTRGSLTKNGYLVFYLKHPYKGYSKRFLAHRLVAEYFVPNKNGRPEIDHIDTDKTNNTSLNLRWVNRSENMKNVITYQKSCTANKNNAKRGGGNPNAKKIHQILGDEIIASYDSAIAASKNTGIPYKRILHCARGEQCLAGGYKWKYIV